MSDAHRCVLDPAKAPSKEGLKISATLEEFAHTVTDLTIVKTELFQSLWYAKSSFNTIKLWILKLLELLGWKYGFLGDFPHFCMGDYRRHSG